MVTQTCMILAPRLAWEEPSWILPPRRVSFYHQTVSDGGHRPLSFFVHAYCILPAMGCLESHGRHVSCPLHQVVVARSPDASASGDFATTEWCWAQVETSWLCILYRPAAAAAVVAAAARLTVAYFQSGVCRGSQLLLPKGVVTFLIPELKQLFFLELLLGV